MAYKPTGRPVGRPKVFNEEEIPLSVVKVVSALCADLPRREKIIKTGDRTDKKTIDAYKRLNDLIYSAFAETEESLRGVFLADIADNRGYGQSAAARVMSYKAFYNRKRQIVCKIARVLDLI